MSIEHSVRPLHIEQRARRHIGAWLAGAAACVFAFALDRRASCRERVYSSV